MAVWLGETIYFCTGPGEQKARNLEHNPHVILTTGCNEWEHGLDVVVEGAADRVTDDEQLRRLADAWTRNGTGAGAIESETAASSTKTATPCWSSRLSPTKVLAFGKGTFSQTRHRFSRS